MASKDFIYPTDRELSKKVLNSGTVKSFLKIILEEQLDDINLYIHDASEHRLGADDPAVGYLREGCELFGVETLPPVYLTRSYQYEICCTGYDKPIIQIPNLLLEKADRELLRGRMMAAAAAIKAEHHKLQFLMWILQNFGNIIPIPFAATAAQGLLNEWYRAQYYTRDRAFYIATKNKELSLKNVLYGEISPEILDHFHFENNGTYEAQVDDFFRINGAVDSVAKINAFFQCEDWLPMRYRELQKYCKEN